MTETQALYEWLKRNWSQDITGKTKHLASMSYSGCRVVRWLVVYGGARH